MRSALSYGGDVANVPSSSTLSQVVTSGGGGSATTLVSSLNPSTAGTSVMFTATVAGSNPTGSVNFKDGASSITGCSAVALTGSGNSKTAAVHDQQPDRGDAQHHGRLRRRRRQRRFDQRGAVAGRQQGDEHHDRRQLCESVNRWRKCHVHRDRQRLAPTGSVNFKDGASSITGCSAVALTGSGNSKTAQCTTSSLTAATHSITAAYGGDAGNAASTSAALSQVVNSVGPGPSTTTVVSSLNPSTAGTSVMFTATVAGSNPTGSVNFKDGASSITGCSAVALTGSGNSKTAACTTSSLTAATHSITAAYGGDAGNAASTSAALSQVVNKVTSTHDRRQLCESVNRWRECHVHRDRQRLAPTGSVNFKDGASSITGCSAVALTGSGNSKTAQCTTSSLTAATHSITAAYGGDAGNAVSTSAALSQVVNSVGPGPSTTTVVSSLNPSTAGDERHVHGNDRRQQSDRQRQLQGRRQLDHRLQRGRAHRQRQQQDGSVHDQQPDRGDAQHHGRLRRRRRQRRFDQRGTVAGRQYRRRIDQCRTREQWRRRQRVEQLQHRLPGVRHHQ